MIIGWYYKIGNGNNGLVFLLYSFFIKISRNLTSDIDSNRVLTWKEKEKLVLDLYFNQNKTYSEIAKIAKISPRGIKSIIDKAINKKQGMQHKSTAKQAYELSSKGKTLLQVTIDLAIINSVNLGRY
jgi:hypothetical protein